jgi:hypothetical protein
MKENFRRYASNGGKKDLHSVLEHLLSAFFDLIKDSKRVRELLFGIISNLGSRLFSMRTSLFYYNVNDMSATLFSCFCYKLNELAKKVKQLKNEGKDHNRKR